MGTFLGSHTSAKKRAAARRNALKGGRPRKYPLAIAKAPAGGSFRLPDAYEDSLANALKAKKKKKNQYLKAASPKPSKKHPQGKKSPFKQS